MPIPPGQQTTKGGYYGYSHWDSVVATLRGSGVPTARGGDLGFRTFLRARHAPVLMGLMMRGGSWHNNTEVYMRPALVWGGLATQGSILRGFRTWRQVRGSLPRE